MTASSSSITPIQAHLRALLSEPAAPPRAHDLGAWNTIADELAAIPDLAARRRAFDAAAKTSAGLRQVLNGAPAQPARAPETRDDSLHIPALPDVATAVYAHEAPCAQWLDDYTAFAVQAAPKTPRSFHVAAGLFAISCAVARRLMFPVADTVIYPNIYILFVADSTRYAKSTGFRILRKTFARAGLAHLLLPQRMTPQAMIEDLSLNVPGGYHLADEQTRQQWLLERSFAAQRGWALDEAQGLFDSFDQDFNTGLLPMILDFYECPDETTEQTKSRWRVTVRDIYLSFFGASTPAGMRKHFANQTLWDNGLWARMALLTPTEPPNWKFWPPTVNTPAAVTEGLQRVAALFPTPQASLWEQETSEGRQKKIRVTGAEPPSAALLAPGVWDAWETYSRAVGFDLLDQAPPELQPPYGRLGTQALKIAMLLAAMDTTELPVRIELRHFARAQRIVEGWRESLHRIRATAAKAQEETMLERVQSRLIDAWPDTVLTRDIYRPLNLSVKLARQLLEELVTQGMAEKVLAIGGNGRQVEAWRAAEGRSVSVSNI